MNITLAVRCIKMKPTKTNLAKHIGMSPQGLNKMRVEHPKKFKLLWNGWMQYCNENKDK